MAYGDFKDLPRRTASGKVLFDKTFDIAKSPKYDGYQRRHVSMVYKFFHKKTAGGVVTNETMQYKNLVQELQKPIIIKFEKRKVHSSFRDSIWGADQADMQLLSKFNKGICFYCVLLICIVNMLRLFL